MDACTADAPQTQNITAQLRSHLVDWHPDDYYARGEVCGGTRISGRPAAAGDGRLFTTRSTLPGVRASAKELPTTRTRSSQLQEKRCRRSSTSRPPARRRSSPARRRLKTSPSPTPRSTRLRRPAARRGWMEACTSRARSRRAPTSARASAPRASSTPPTSSAASGRALHSSPPLPLIAPPHLSEP